MPFQIKKRLVFAICTCLLSCHLLVASASKSYDDDGNDGFTGSHHGGYHDSYPNDEEADAQDISSLNQRIEELEKDITAMQIELEKKEEEHKKSQKESQDQYQEALNNQNSEIEGLNSQVSSLKKEIEEYKKEIERLSTQFNEAQKDTARIRNSLEAKYTLINSLNLESKDKDARISELENQLNELNDRMIENEQDKNTISKLEADNEELVAKLSISEKTIKDLNKQIKKLNEEIQDNGTENNELKNKINEQVNKINSLIAAVKSNEKSSYGNSTPRTYRQGSVGGGIPDNRDKRKSNFFERTSSLTGPALKNSLDGLRLYNYNSNNNPDIASKRDEDYSRTHNDSGSLSLFSQSDEEDSNNNPDIGSENGDDNAYFPFSQYDEEDGNNATDVGVYIHDQNPSLPTLGLSQENINKFLSNATDNSKEAKLEVVNEDVASRSGTSEGGTEENDENISEEALRSDEEVGGSLLQANSTDTPNGITREGPFDLPSQDGSKDKKIKVLSMLLIFSAAVNVILILLPNPFKNKATPVAQENAYGDLPKKITIRS